jgi:hypothetical protein
VAIALPEDYVRPGLVLGLLSFMTQPEVCGAWLRKHRRPWPRLIRINESDDTWSHSLSRPEAL